MTAELKRDLKGVLLAVLVGGSGGWGVVEYRVGHLEQQLANIENRVQAIYCAAVPVEIREGCR